MPLEFVTTTGKPAMTIQLLKQEILGRLHNRDPETQVRELDGGDHFGLLVNDRIWIGANQATGHLLIKTLGAEAVRVPLTDPVLFDELERGFA
jgi:hypothetical protein